MVNKMQQTEVTLFDALVSVDNASEAENFLIDLCSPSELRALTERWRVCQLLSCGEFSYREIKLKTGASLTTIGRVARFLNDEKYGGYKNILEKMRKKNEK
jgi:TrpR-related protein YerC/YecD